MAGDLNLSNLKPAQARKTRKRVGRGMGSGIWPPSKPARMAWEPDRDFWPLIPRPE